jgi:transposase InsO family protein
VSLDDLLAAVREFLNPKVSRSGRDRCLRRHGVGNLHDLQAKNPRPKHKAFKAYEPGYLHVDVKYLPQMAEETSRRYLFVAIDRATRWVFIRIFKAKTAANARRFLRDLKRACPIRIRTILTDNGKEFPDRLIGLRKRAAIGEHEFNTLCASLDIEHRLTPPKSPQTNGMVERFNGRVEDVLQSHHFRSGEEQEMTMHRYFWLYIQQLPQPALGSKSPLQAMQDWYKIKPELFKKQPYNLSGCYSGTASLHCRDEAVCSLLTPGGQASSTGWSHGSRNARCRRSSMAWALRCSGWTGGKASWALPSMFPMASPSPLSPSNQATDRSPLGPNSLY